MKNKYIKPTVEMVDLYIEGVIATSGTDIGVNKDDEYTGASFSKKRFWDEKD